MMNEKKLIEVVKTNNPSEPDTYQRKVTVYINGQYSDFDIVEFCSEKGIALTDMRLVSRLFQFGLDTLNYVWKDGITDPVTLYQEALKYTKTSLGGNL